MLCRRIVTRVAATLLSASAASAPLRLTRLHSDVTFLLFFSILLIFVLLAVLSLMYAFCSLYFMILDYFHEWRCAVEGEDLAYFNSLDSPT